MKQFRLSPEAVLDLNANTRQNELKHAWARQIRQSKTIYV